MAKLEGEVKLLPQKREKIERNAVRKGMDGRDGYAPV